MFLSKYDFFRSCAGQKQNFKTNDTNILQNGEFIQRWRNSSITKFRQSQKLSLNLKNPELKNCPKNILGILNLISNEGVQRFNSKFSKEITFCQSYGFIKSQPQVVYNLAVRVRFVKRRFAFQNPFQETNTFYQTTYIVQSNNFPAIQPVDLVYMITPVPFARLCC